MAAVRQVTGAKATGQVKGGNRSTAHPNPRVRSEFQRNTDSQNQVEARKSGWQRVSMPRGPGTA